MRAARGGPLWVDPGHQAGHLREVRVEDEGETGAEDGGGDQAHHETEAQERGGDRDEGGAGECAARSSPEALWVGGAGGQSNLEEVVEEVVQGGGDHLGAERSRWTRRVGGR